MKVKELPIISIKECYCYRDIIELLNLPVNGKSVKLVKEYILLHKLDFSHFDRNKKNKKYEIITKQCPICFKNFEVKERTY